MEVRNWIFLILIGTTALALLFFFSPSFAKAAEATANGPFDLSKQTTSVIEMKETSTFTKAGGEGAAFSLFVYINPLLRTGEHVQCGSSPDMPSCETGEYTPCEIVGTQTCNHAGYSQVFDLGAVLQLEVLRAPDASRPSAAAVHLTLKTQGPPNKLYKETFVLPPIPFQKWVMVTISREGRQFNIYYNDELVLSKSTMYQVYAQSGVGTTIGHSMLVGQAALATIYPAAINGGRIAQIYATSVDTRGFPSISGLERMPGGADAIGLYPTYNPSLTFGKFWDSLSVCGEGGCLSAPAVRPANPLYQWTSPYA